MEALFRLCEKHGKVLYRYDFNEPCKGKDQCDQEAAYAKSLLRSYVDSGKNVLNAYDIAKAFQYARVSWYNGGCSWGEQFQTTPDCT